MKIKILNFKSKSKSSNNTPSVIPSVNDINIGMGQHQEAPWFNKKDVIIEHFTDPPIVYSSNFGIVEINRGEVGEDGVVYELENKRIDTDTIRKQDQYGYKGEDATITEEDLPEDVFENNKFKLEIPESDTVDILTEEEKFNSRWKEIKEKSDKKANIVE